MNRYAKPPKQEKSSLVRGANHELGRFGTPIARTYASQPCLGVIWNRLRFHKLCLWSAQGYNEQPFIFAGAAREVPQRPLIASSRRTPWDAPT